MAHIAVNDCPSLPSAAPKPVFVGESLRVTTSLPAVRTPAADGQTELRVEIPVGDGRVDQLVIDYLWRKEGK